MNTLIRQKIALVSHNVSGNCMYRTLLLYRALEPYYEMEIIGFDRGGGLWPPLRDESFNLRTVPFGGWFSFLASAYKLLKPLQADVLIASKTRLPSLGLALLNRLFRGTPVVVDIDDDERAMTRPPASVKLRTVVLYNLRNPDAYFTASLMHVLARKADHVFCVSENFRKLHGGSIVPHGLKPHTAELDAQKMEVLRDSLGIVGAFVVIFVGTPRAHKGIAETLQGARLSGIERIKVVVVGATPNDEYTNALHAEFGDLLIRVPPQPSSEIPYFLALGNATVLAQKDSPESHGQMPAKLTDAMFAGIPVIATAVSDIPRYLEGGGILIDTPDPELISEALKWVFHNPDEARKLGEKARKMALENLSDQAISKVMIEALSTILRK